MQRWINKYTGKSYDVTVERLPSGSRWIMVNATKYELHKGEQLRTLMNYLGLVKAD